MILSHQWPCLNSERSGGKSKEAQGSKSPKLIGLFSTSQHHLRGNSAHPFLAMKLQQSPNWLMSRQLLCLCPGPLSSTGERHPKSTCIFWWKHAANVSGKLFHFNGRFLNQPHWANYSHVLSLPHMLSPLLLSRP